MFSASSNNNNSNKRQLEFSVENLEPREMLAGDVMVEIVNQGGFSILEITGDENSNRVEIVSDGNTVSLTGRGTDLNGQRETLQFNVADIDGYAIAMGEGNDQLTMVADNDTESGFVGIGMAIDMGDGNDRIRLIAQNGGASQNGFHFGIVQIETSDGNDRVEMFAENTSGIGFHNEAEFIVNTGSGNDRVTLNAETEDATNSNAMAFLIDDFLTINTHASDAGNDRVTITTQNDGDFFVGENLSIDVGNGKNRIDITAMDAGEIKVDDSLNLIAGNGGNRVNIIAENSSGNGFDIGNEILVETGSGSDRIAIRAENSSVNHGFAIAGALGIRAGGGNDRIDLIADNDAGTGFYIEMGMLILGDAGDDRINLVARGTGQDGFVVNSFVDFFGTRFAYAIDGAEGNDRINVDADNRNGTGFRSNDPDGAMLIGGGDDDDRVTLDSRLATGFDVDVIEVDGGDGIDRLTNDAVANAVETNFEQ